jgi:hypothetical protein
MSVAITTNMGTFTPTPVTVAATATLLVAASIVNQRVIVINNSPSVMDIGGPTVAPGTGIPVQGGGDSIDLVLAPQGGTASGLYAAYSGGGGDARVVVLS